MPKCSGAVYWKTILSASNHLRTFVEQVDYIYVNQLFLGPLLCSLDLCVCAYAVLATGVKISFEIG